ncbi:unnamed protein product [Allacma fusca]|uniref:Uncharacterized protein n=1 Tax=Allacma fusca TaxID=39272 RepID=A0A8J2NXQ4_9HEXA|nr:unnamed protein product [Allacma fusca]
MPKGSICCCGARTWTRFIGWFDLVYALVNFITLFVTLLQSSIWEGDGNTFIATILETLGIDYFFKIDDPDNLYIMGWILTFLAFLPIPFSLVLLIGSYKAKPRLLKVWIYTFATVLTVVALMAIIQVILLNKGLEIFQNIIFILMGLIIQARALVFVCLEMPEQEICCCGAGVWTKSIGWFYFVSSIFHVFTLLVVLTLIPWEKKGKDIVISMMERYGVKAQNFDSSDLYANGWVILFESLFGIFLSYLLLKGSYCKRPCLLKIWVFLTVVFTLVWLINAGVASLKQENTMERFRWIFTVIVAFAIQSFCVWVVRIHEQELRGHHLEGTEDTKEDGSVQEKTDASRSC